MAFSCPPCGRNFISLDALNKHARESPRHRKRVDRRPQPRELPQPNPHQSRDIRPEVTNSHELNFNRTMTTSPHQSTSNGPDITSSHPTSYGRPQIRNHSYATPDNLPSVGTMQMHSRPSPNSPTPSQNWSHAQQNMSVKSHTWKGETYYTYHTPTTLPNRIPSWSWTFPKSDYHTTFDALIANCHSLADLKQNNYIVDLYHRGEYTTARKCQRCQGREYKLINKPCVFHAFGRNKQNPRKPYKCCDTIDGPGCQTLPHHDFQLSSRAMSHKDYLPTPPASPFQQKYKAVVFDCEMAGIASGAGEAILICASDYLSGEVLLHRYVRPSASIVQMRDEVHGISLQTLNIAISQGQALPGWAGARAELWKFIDADTVLVGHALQNDLDALRMIHHRVVDSGILARKAVGIHRIRWSLSALCEGLLEMRIRESKGSVHDCLEDVMGTREVVLVCTRRRERFLNWARETRRKELELEAEREEKKKADLKMKEEEAGKIAGMTVAERAAYLSKG